MNSEEFEETLKQYAGREVIVRFTWGTMQEYKLYPEIIHDIRLSGAYRVLWHNRVSSRWNIMELFPKEIESVKLKGVN